MLPLDEDECSADEEPGEGLLAVPGLRDLEAERHALVRLLALAGTARAADSKWRALARLLARTGEPAIVFTEYRDTLARLAERLRPLDTVALIHGGMDAAARRQAVADFTSGRARLLLATDAAAHGLNLHARCRLVINVELPWMPARLEQRIGRVDRIGQRRLVHAVHLVARRTAEEGVLARLVLRIGRERAALGGADNPLGTRGELDVARVVFGEAMNVPPPGQEVTDETACARRVGMEAPAEEERQRSERARLLAAANRLRTARKERASPAFLRPLWTVMRRWPLMVGLPPGLVCLFAARFVDDRGSLVEETVLALHVTLAWPLLPRRVLASSVPALLAACRPELDRLASSLAARRLEELRTCVPSHLGPLAAREAAIAALDASAPAPVQAGLFDCRALKRAASARRRYEQDAAESEVRLREVARRATVEMAEAPRLTLVLGLAI